MIHLAEKDPQGTFLPKDTRKKAEVISWLMFQMVKTVISSVTPSLTQTQTGAAIINTRSCCCSSALHVKAWFLFAGRYWSHARPSKPLCAVCTRAD